MGKPLFFLHIAKTGGTSLSQAVATRFAADRRFSDNAAVSVAYLSALGAALDGEAFVWGHATPGAGAFLRDRADTITLVRRPADQVVSHYLHLRSNPEDPRHEDARGLDFADFLRRRPDMIGYQTLAIASALNGEAVEDLVFEPARALATATGYLDTMAFVGVLERAEACRAFLSWMIGADPPLRLPRLNSARARGEPAALEQDLRDTYERLRAAGEFAELFAAEASLYAHAAALQDRHMARLAAATTPERLAAPRAFHIPAAQFQSLRGRMEGSRLVCPVAEGAEPLVHGPYECLAPGDYEVLFHFTGRDLTLGPWSGLRLEVLADGERFLAQGVVHNPAAARPAPPALRFQVARAEEMLEFRVARAGLAGGELAFEGVSIRPAPTG